MRFRDDKSIRCGSYTFEHARIVQGSLEYAVITVLAIIGYLNEQKLLALLIVAIIGGVFLCCVAFYAYKLKGKPKKHILKIALLKFATLPASMVG